MTFRLTAQEYEGLKQAAKDNGLPVSQYVTQHVMAGKGLTLDQIRTIYHQLLNDY